MLPQVRVTKKGLIDRAHPAGRLAANACKTLLAKSKCASDKINVSTRGDEEAATVAFAKADSVRA